MKEILERVSVRKYEARPVEREKLEALLRAAMAAPSAGNQQPWEFAVVQERALLDRLAGASPYAKPLLAAPAGIAVLSRTQGLRFPEYWQQDLGAVWMGIAPLEERMRAVAEILGLGEGLQAFALVAVGYPAEKAAPHDRFDPSRVQWR